ncbi:hypothetical protein COY27_03415 [Candidatus Woesearchaeota archaeon CG_4_10_14_0_2_um_filter_33_13]|nr:MAG: hypothetical protein COY27_03415 [Candidatus Woesearchaeota archaeon CG_4_10_14_0_2_um_filter_33_13]
MTDIDPVEISHKKMWVTLLYERIKSAGDYKILPMIMSNQRGLVTCLENEQAEKLIQLIRKHRERTGYLVYESNPKRKGNYYELVLRTCQSMIPVLLDEDQFAKFRVVAER